MSGDLSQKDAATLQQALLTTSTEKRYKELIKLHNEPELIEKLPGGGSVGWFGSKYSQRVLAYIHGGGLVVYATLAQVQMAYDAYKAAKASIGEIALAILFYDPCRFVPYPGQLSQTVSFAQYLIKDRKPENVSLFGESAGGMLILALLLHASHPHPKVPPFIMQAGHKFNRALLISPAGPVKTSAGSMASNADKDSLKPDILSSLWATLEADHDPEVELVNQWLTPTLRLEESWYENMPVNDITITVGDYELHRDDILQVSEVIKRNHKGSVDTCVFPETVHVAYVMEMMMQKPLSAYSLAVIDWARKV